MPREGLPKPPQQPAPVLAPDLAFIHANAKARARHTHGVDEETFFVMAIGQTRKLPRRTALGE